MIGAWVLCMLVGYATVGVSAKTPAKEATVLLEDGKWRLEDSMIDHDGVAYARFHDEGKTTGWGKLVVTTNALKSDRDQAFAAGYCEGYLTSGHIFNASVDLAPQVFHGGSPPASVVKFMQEQDAWWRDEVSKNSGDDPFWYQAGLLLAQFDGLVAGYDRAVEEGLVPELAMSSKWSLQVINGVGDLFQIVPAVEKKLRVDWSSLTKERAERLHFEQGHCSALIKVTGDYSDLLLSHSSWFTYAATNRIFKYYNFAFSEESLTAAQTVSFSSYPGMLESLDDFYMLSSNISWTQTSNGVMNSSVLDSVKPESLLAWQRVRIASSMAADGAAWARTFSKAASGTYANQYMVVDMNKFRPHEQLRPGLLTVVEEMPGLIVFDDETSTLERGYWPSYNVPYFEEIYARSGYPEAVEKYGPSMSYQLAPRAQIFRRNQSSAITLDGLKDLMRYNDFERDPYSFDGKEQNPMYAICSRGDLRKASPSPGGCYDTKVTSYSYGMMELKAQAINGPTRSLGFGNLKPFSWRNGFEDTKHRGLPEVYDFDFVSMENENF
eukprot:g1690.t1